MLFRLLTNQHSKEPVFLSLPEDHICLKDRDPPVILPFTIKPIDGEIKANVPAGKKLRVTKDANGKYVFDSSLTDSDLYGQLIEFTVDESYGLCHYSVCRYSCECNN